MPARCDGLSTLADGVRRVAISLELPSYTPPQAFAAFVTHVWHGGGGLGKPRLLPNEDATQSTGEDDALEGLVVHRARVVPGPITEQITDIRMGKEIKYYVKSGPFPVSYHSGVVNFKQEGDGALIEWQVDFKPNFWGIFCCCGGSGVTKIISISLSTMLDNLEKQK